MPPPLEDIFEFPVNYEVVALERIERLGGKRVLAFPGAQAVDPQQEQTAAPILEVRPAAAEPWIGIFYGEGYAAPPAVPGALVGLPDEWTFAVVYAGRAVLVRADDPTVTSEVPRFPITDLLVVPGEEVVLFFDFTNLVAYGKDGLLWESRRLALDDLKLIRAKGNTLHVEGFFGEDTQHFTVDLPTGEAQGQPWQPPE
jgi:hypothetical protein